MAPHKATKTRPTVLTCPTPSHNSTSSGMPHSVPHHATQSDSVLQPEDERESERQTWFQNQSNNIYNVPNGYLKVSVLIIRWDEGIDEFAGHAKEIERLKSIFTEKFRYDCSVFNIGNTRKPQTELDFAILRHVRDNDGPNNLLVVYYTGHGNQVKDTRLELSATTRKWVAKKDAYLPTAFWDEAERPLLKSAEGNVLSILDCCFASSAAFKSRCESNRTYQLLAASALDSPTEGPGENSFTKALSDSLEELLAESNGANFTVTKLHERINKKRRTQSAVLWDRLEHFNRFLQLSRLDAAQERSAFDQDKDPEKSSLTLRFSLKVDDLTKGQIERLPECLKEACNEAQVEVRRIDWVKLEKAKIVEDGFLKFAKAVNVVRRAMRRKIATKKNKKEKRRLRERKKAQIGTYLATPKRRLRASSSASEGISPMSDTPVSSINSFSGFE